MGGKAIGYIRVSRVGGARAIVPEPGLQRASIERSANARGLALVDVWKSLTRAAATHRPLWNSCIQRIESGEADALCVWNLDRFSRSIIDGFRAIQRIEDAGEGSSARTGPAPSWIAGSVCHGRGLPRPGPRWIPPGHGLSHRAWCLHQPQGAFRLCPRPGDARLTPIRRRPPSWSSCSSAGRAASPG